ncbi:MAG: 5'-3' exonuclease H3TH domain-containing protein [bacterium]
MKRLIVIDGHNFLWRAYSVPFKFYSQRKTPLHVVSTYLSLVRRALTSLESSTQTDSVVIVFDTNTSNSNKELSEDYKANRKRFAEDEDSPYAHLSYVRTVLEDLSIGFLEIPNIEADDIIASVSKGFCKRDSTNKAFIVSTDSDFYQLLDGQIFIVKLKACQDHEIVDHHYVKNKLGVSPDQYVEFKSLVGDTADNIKGVAGVGPVTARKIIHNTIEFDMKPHTETMTLNRKLITLDCGCKKQWRFKDFAYNDDVMNISNKEIFKRCNF